MECRVVHEKKLSVFSIATGVLEEIVLVPLFVLQVQKYKA